MRFILLASLLALAACGQQQVAYPPDAELNFRNACEAQGTAASVCECVWQRVEAEVPARDFIALESLSIPEVVDHPLTAQIEGYQVACSAESEVEPDGELPPAP